MDFNLDKMPVSEEERQQVRVALEALLADHGDRLADVTSVRVAWQSDEDASRWALTIARRDGTQAQSVFPAPIGLAPAFAAKRILNAVADLAPKEVRFRQGVTLPSRAYEDWIAGTSCPSCHRPATERLALYLPSDPDCIGRPVAEAFIHGERDSCRRYIDEASLRRMREAGLIEDQ